MWQELRAELAPHGVEVVTVALDTGGVEAAGSFIDAADAQHPSLIDVEHRLDELLGINNVPMGVWIDEQGMLVRPPEIAHPGRNVLREMLAKNPLPDDAPVFVREMLAETAKIRVAPERYAAALRDWAARGAESPHALEPEEVVERSRPRPREASEAAAHFARQARHQAPAGGNWHIAGARLIDLPQLDQDLEVWSRASAHPT